MPKVPGYSDEELELLTEEELSGLLEGATTASDDTDANDDTDTTTAGEGDDTLEAGAAGDDTTTEDENGATTEAEPDATQAADTTTAGAGDDTLPAGAADADQGPIEVEIDDLAPPVTTFNIAEAQTRIKDLDAQMDALAKKADDGEIDLQTLTTQQRQLQDQRDDLKADVRYAENHVKDAMTVFTRHAETFLAKPENVAYRSGLFYKLLDDTVRQVQAVAIENGRNAFDPKILDKAVAIVDGQLATRFGARQAPKTTDPGTPAPKPSARPQRNLPPNLSTVPAADDGGNPMGAGGEYALAARLAEENTLEYERLLRTWPREKVEDFLSRGI